MYLVTMSNKVRTSLVSELKTVDFIFLSYFILFSIHMSQSYNHMIHERI